MSLPGRWIKGTENKIFKMFFLDNFLLYIYFFSVIFINYIFILFFRICRGTLKVHWSYFFEIFSRRISKLGNTYKTGHVFIFLNSSPKSPEIGHRRSPKMDNRYPEWGTRFPKRGTRFPEWGTRFPELGIRFPERWSNCDIELSGKDTFRAFWKGELTGEGF